MRRAGGRLGLSIAIAAGGMALTTDAARAEGIPNCDSEVVGSTLAFGSSLNANYMVPFNLAHAQQPGGFGYDCYLHHGPNGGGVAALQRSLNACNGQHLVVDGSFGPRTEAAVRAVQRANGIVVDGVYGPQTRDHMAWLVWTSPGHETCWRR
jgi:hypothetical protein